MEQTLSLAQLSPADRKKLMRELQEQQKTEEKELREKRNAYKKDVSDAVKAIFPELQEASQYLAKVKSLVYEKLKSFTAIKAELYDREDDQFSHTFTCDDGSISITIGANMNDGWDDTVEVGIGKVNDYLQSLAKDKDSKALVKAVLKLLSKDAKGNLKTSRVLALRQMAEDSGNEKFIDAIKIIQDAHRPVRTKEFVRCEYKGNDGSKIILPLNITDVVL